MGWVDLFIRTEYKEIIIESLKYCIANKGLNVHAYVIMTIHIHLIVSTKDGVRLSSLIRDFKTHTSKKLLLTIKHIIESRREWILNKFRFEANRQKRGKEFKLRQDGFHPIEILSAEMATQKLDDIHQNPVNEGIVYETIYYIYSSASHYAGKSSKRNIEFLI